MQGFLQGFLSITAERNVYCIDWIILYHSVGVPFLPKFLAYNLLHTEYTEFVVLHTRPPILDKGTPILIKRQTLNSISFISLKFSIAISKLGHILYIVFFRSSHPEKRHAVSVLAANMISLYISVSCWHEALNVSISTEDCKALFSDILSANSILSFSSFNWATTLLSPSSSDSILCSGATCLSKIYFNICIRLRISLFLLRFTIHINIITNNKNTTKKTEVTTSRFFRRLSCRRLNISASRRL